MYRGRFIDEASVLKALGLRVGCCGISLIGQAPYRRVSCERLRCFNCLRAFDPPRPAPHAFDTLYVCPGCLAWTIIYVECPCANGGLHLGTRCTHFQLCDIHNKMVCADCGRSTERY